MNTKVVVLILTQNLIATFAFAALNSNNTTGDINFSPTFKVISKQEQNERYPEQQPPDSRLVNAEAYCFEYMHPNPNEAGWRVFNPLKPASILHFNYKQECLAAAERLRAMPGYY